MVWEDLTPQRVLRRASFDNGIACAMAHGLQHQRHHPRHRHVAPRRPGGDAGRLRRRQPPRAGDCQHPAQRRHLPDGGLLLRRRPAGDAAAHPRPSEDRGDDDQRPHAGREHRRREVYDDDVIRPLDRPIYAEGALAVLRGNLAPDGVVIKPSACARAPAAPQRPRAGVRRLPVAEEGGGRPGARRHRRRRAGAALCRPQGRGHAGMGHAADPDQAAEGRASPTCCA